MAYKVGDRLQKTLFPNIIDDYIGKHDPVRVYDSFVDSLNLEKLGIVEEYNKAGADEYQPRNMLKLIIYGYSYGVRTSRKLELACHHNLSFIWLMGGLKPAYRTIARFRSENKGVIKNVLKQCVKLCIKFNLIEGNTLFVDGSSFRGDASIRNTWTRERCDKALKAIDKRIDELVEEAERIDKEEEEKGSLVEIKEELRDKEVLKEKIQEIASELNNTGKAQTNTTDADCVKVKGRQGLHAGYNVQMAVDEKHGLIVNSEATSHSQDANQFSEQVKKASEVLNKKPKAVCSDSGYHSVKDISKVDKNIMVVMPSQKQVQEENGFFLGPFDKDRFTYDVQKDEYICPGGNRLTYIGTAKSGRRVGNRLFRAKADECQSCRHFGICTKSIHGRTIDRLREEVLKDKLEKIYVSAEGQRIYKQRKEKVELTFGHIKRNLKAGQFLLRGKDKVDAEVSILSTCFNIVRMITIVGIPDLLSMFQLP